jgi:hypothetical protein
MEYATALGNHLCNLLNLPNPICNRFRQWCITAYGNGMLPLMVMVCYRLW